MRQTMKVIQAVIAFAFLADKKTFGIPAPENDVHFHINMAGTADTQRDESMVTQNQEDLERGQDYSEDSSKDKHYCEGKTIAKEWKKTCDEVHLKYWHLLTDDISNAKRVETEKKFDISDGKCEDIKVEIAKAVNVGSVVYGSVCPTKVNLNVPRDLDRSQLRISCLRKGIIKQDTMIRCKCKRVPYWSQSCNEKAQWEE